MSGSQMSQLAIQLQLNQQQPE